MLYLNPPFFLIDGVTLFPDHADPLQFYFLPMQPHFTTIAGPSGAPVPSLQLLKYRGDAGAGGFLNFDVDLSLPDGVLQDIAGQLRGQAHLSGTPKLAPVPLVDGAVKMILFGKESPPPPDPRGATTPPRPATPAPDAANGPQFVLKIQGAAKPSLYGNNNATFSVQLDQYGVDLMEQAMIHGVISPIAVIYELDFLALRPAFSVKLHVDWNRVQTHFDESFSGGFLFFSTDVDKAIDKLVEDRVIQIDVDTFVPEGEDEAASADRDRAVSEVRDMIKSTFFESSLPPPKPGDPDGWDKAAKFLGSMSQLAVTGGWSSMGSLSYKKVDLTRIDQKTLNVNFNERTTVRRQIYPQGHMTGMLNFLRGSGVSLDQYIIPVDLNDPYFQRRQVNVVSRANFDLESLAAISVNLKYGDNLKNVELKSSTDSGSVSWPSVLVSGAMKREVQYSYQCVFKNVDGLQRPVQLSAPAVTTTFDTLEVQPSGSLYSYSVVPIVALGNFWDTYPTVEVETRYEDEANNIHLRATFLLTKDQPQFAWQVFLRDSTKRAIQYRATYRAADNRDIASGWIATDQESIILHDPLPNKRTLYIMPAVDWNAIDRVEVDVSYTDVDGSTKEGHFEFSQADAATKVFSTPLKDPSRRLVSYEITLLKKGGGVIVVPESFTTGRQLTILGDMKGHRIVGVHPAAVDFGAKRVKSIDVAMRYVDDVNHVAFNDSHTFTSSADLWQFEFDYVDDQQSKYQYKITTNLKSGLTKAGDWTDATGQELVIPVG